MNTGETKRGAIAWMTKNHVTANLIMILFIVGGLIMAGRIKQEIFPDLNLDFVFITVPYPGASPEEIEEGIVLAIEEEVRGLDDVKEVTAYCSEGIGTVAVELQLGTNKNKALTDIKNAVDSIQTFPEDIERYTVSLAMNKVHVITMVLHGEQTEAALRKLAEDVREDLIAMPDITQVELGSVRRPEISIEIPQSTLREYNLTLDNVAGIIRASALDLPGGRVKAAGGEILIRTKEKRYYATEYESIPIVTRNDGTVIRLRDIGDVRETFEDSDISAVYNGVPAVRLDVYRVGDETPTEISETVRDYIETLNQRLPDTVTASIWEDRSEMLRDRINLLMKNAMIGLILVLILLGLAMDVRLAFWVTMGIPTSILGALLFFPAMDLSINMVSLFAVIITVGIVVDDAVIVGENVFHMRKQGMDYLTAAITGAKQMAVPVTFSILTNIAAFMPLFFLPGVTGKIFRVIPSAVVIIFLISLVEALFILPAHLSKRSRSEDSGWIASLNKRREWFGRTLMWVRDHTFKPSLKLALEFRYVTIASALGMLLFMIGMIASGRIDFSFMPKTEHEQITASVEMPFGTPIRQTRAIQEEMLSAAEQIIAENGGMDIVRGIYAEVGSAARRGGAVNIGSEATGSHIAYVSIYMVPIDQREITAERFATTWNKRLKHLTGIETLSFNYTIGAAGNQPINLSLSHNDKQTLEKAASELAEALTGYAGVRDVDDGYSAGKTQFDFRIRPEARALGLTASELARQVRGAFYGAEALRLQRKRDEVKVMVRYPEADRHTPFSLENMLIRTPMGTEIPLNQAADMVEGTSYTQIQRSDGRRVLNVTADVEAGVANADKVIASVRETELPELFKKYPGLRMELEGEQEDKAEAMAALGFGFIFALFGIYALLAIPFKSYSQPIIIMTAIPFGIIGAVLGHLLMGFEMSVISMMGIVALAGVVVNDSLILIDTANHNYWGGMDPLEAVTAASLRRFRPIVLTSLTTFLGLAPMIFETALQARFLIPMAISLGFGILFATFIALVIIPSLYMALVDIKRLLGVHGELSHAEKEAVQQRS